MTGLICRRVDKGAKLKVEHVKNTEGLEGLIQLLKDDIVNVRADLKNR
jgi:hypothetical protein